MNIQKLSNQEFADRVQKFAQDADLTKRPARIRLGEYLRESARRGDTETLDTIAAALIIS